MSSDGSSVKNTASSTVVSPPATAFVCTEDNQVSLAMADKNDPAAGIWLIDYTENSSWIKADVLGVATDNSRFMVEFSEGDATSGFFVSLDQIGSARHATLYSVSRSSDLSIKEATAAFFHRQSAKEFDQLADLSCR